MANKLPVFMVLLSVSAPSPLAACGGADGAASTDVAGAVAPDPIVVAAERTDLVFRYVDPATGKVATSVTVDGIPVAARGAVVVFDEVAPAPPGWDFVADLSAGLPVAAKPVEGFSLETRAAAPPPPEIAARQDAEVVMFSRDGCGFCRKARSWLTAERVPFSEFNLDRDPKAMKRLSALAAKAGLSQGRLSGVPIIFVGDKATVGFDKGRLKKLLGV